MTGSVPGSARQTGQTRVFGSSGAPSGADVGQPQNILDSVRSCAWTSIPMIVSYWVVTAMRPIVPARPRPLATRYPARHEDR